MLLMSHPTGNANAREAALGLLEAGLLGELWTSIAWNDRSLADSLLPAAVTAQLRRRTWPRELRGRLHTAPSRELGRLLASRMGPRWLTAHERGPFSVDAVFRALDQRVAERLRTARGVRGVYAYEDGAAASFRAASELGLRRIYDLPIGYWRAAQSLYEQEATRQPQWAATLTGRQDSEAKLARKDEELELAEVVVVASTFTKSTLCAAPRCTAPVHVIPYGAPHSACSSAHARPRDPHRLRVLFAGSLTQRKGLSYLLEAATTLGPRIQLTLLGSKPGVACAALDEATRAHRWIPSLPHAQVLQEMAQHDVLVFPSLFEGFGLVILEAMSQGTPVIATAHTAAPDLIEDGIDGFLVPIRDSAAIAARLERLLREPELLLAMSDAARKKAAAHSWLTYRRRLAALVHEALTPSPAPRRAVAGTIPRPVS
jgi:starch synthase